MAELLGPDVEREWIGLPPVETTFDGALVDAMTASITAEDPGARVLPYMLSGGRMPSRSSSWGFGTSGSRR
nr:hypothetical protein GCM10017745_36670 [Saccharothrix mutabilis subsp. capreolus]